MSCCITSRLSSLWALIIDIYKYKYIVAFHIAYLRVCLSLLVRLLVFSQWNRRCWLLLVVVWTVRLITARPRLEAINELDAQGKWSKREREKVTITFIVPVDVVALEHKPSRDFATSWPTSLLSPRGDYRVRWTCGYFLTFPLSISCFFINLNLRLPRLDEAWVMRVTIHYVDHCSTLTLRRHKWQGRPNIKTTARHKPSF